MLGPSGSEPTPEAIMALSQQERISKRLKACTAWNQLSRLWVTKIVRLGGRVESAVWRHNTGTAVYLYFCCLWIGLLVFMCIFVPLLLPRLYDDSEEHCAPDGSFRMEPFSLLDPAWTFQVVIGFGSLDFTVVKTIDIVWDVLVGRAGQTLLAYITWKTFSKYISGVITTDPITYQTFWTIFLQDAPSFLSISRTLRDFTRYKGLRSEGTMLFMVMAMIFVLVFPTLISSMSGYSAANQAMIKTDNINQVPFSEFKRALYIIHDGNRIRKSVDFAIADEHSACGSSDCVSDYISMFGISRAGQASIWDGIGLNAPSLNITTYWQHNASGGSPSDKAPFAYDNKVYGMEYFTKNRTICQPIVSPDQAQQKYQWGFSIIQLEITLCLLTLWSFGICIMWATAHLRFTNKGIAYSVSGKFKSAIILADALRMEIREVTEEDIDSLTEREMLSCIKMDLNGGSMMQVQSLPPILRHSDWKLIQMWIKANKARAVAIPVFSLSIIAMVASLIDMTAETG